MRPWCILAFLCLLPGCKLRLSMPEFDRINRSLEVRSVIFEEDFSLYSTLPLEETAPYVGVVREELDLVKALFEVQIEEPVVGMLRGIENVTPNIERTADHFSASWLAGTATERAFSIFVADEVEIRGPDGESVVFQFGERNYRTVIRHELAHVCEYLTGVRGKLWLSEGVAEEVESMVLKDGRLTSRPLPENLRDAARLDRQAWRLSSLFHMRQDTKKVASGLERVDLRNRAIAHALVRFFIARHRHLSFRRLIHEIDAMGEGEILALEGAFKDWLEEIRWSSGGGFLE